MITIATITALSAGVAALSARYGADSRPGFDGRKPRV
jgi:hypothetical protein